VPVERDPRTGRLLERDPTGRTEKERAGRSDGASGWKAPAIAVAVTAVVLGLVLGGWLFTGRIGGDPTPASGGAAMPTSEVPGSAPAGSVPGTTEGNRTAEVTTPPTTGETTSGAATSGTTTGGTTTGGTTTGETTTGEGTSPAPPAGSAPAAPSDLAASAVDSTSVVLSWTDNSSDESGFEIGTDAGSRAVGADIREHVWDGLAAGQQVCFRIRAVGGGGPSAWHPEPPASPVCATTEAAPAPPAVDLEVTGIDQLADDDYYDYVCVGSSPAFLASFANSGTDPSGAVGVRWLLDGVPVLDEVHPGLAGGGSDVHEYAVPEVTAGPHTVTFVVDPGGAIPELDETDNQAALAFDADYCVE
jgi:hypothetical protein